MNPSARYYEINELNELSTADNKTRIASGRRQRRDEVLTMLVSTQNARYAYATDLHAIPDKVLLTVAIRNLVDGHTCTFDMSMPVERYDAAKFLAFIDGTA